jgi:hypothetical protein
MVMIVRESWYPLKVAPLVAQKYLEGMQTPINESFGEMVLLPILQQTKEGIHVIEVWGCKDDKIKDSMMALQKQMLPFAEIEGYQFSMDTYVDVTEAYSVIGMKGPQ